MIPSEAQAERIGERETGGKRGEDFWVFSYIHRRSQLTAFAVRTANGLVTQLPRAAVSAQVTKG